MVSILKTLKYRFLECGAKILGFFSNTSLKFGPPKGYYLSAKEYISQNPSMGRIKTLSADPNKYLLAIKKGRICLNPWAFITADDKLLFKESNCYNTKPHKHWVFRSLKFPKVKKISGKVLFLSARTNYYHLMIDELSFLNMVCEIGLRMNSFDYIVCEKPNYPAAQTIFKIWGICKHKIISLDEHKHLQCDLLYFGGGDHALSKEAIYKTLEKLNHYYNIPLASKATGNKRTVIIRPCSHTRRWLNEKECLSKLKMLGFQEVSLDTKSLGEQMEIFAETKIVVAVHGAALTNIIFMRPGTRVIEIRYKKQGGEYSSASCYERLSEIIGINHEILQSDGVERLELKGRSIEDADLIINCDELIKLTKI